MGRCCKVQVIKNNVMPLEVLKLMEKCKISVTQKNLKI